MASGKGPANHQAFLFVHLRSAGFAFGSPHAIFNFLTPLTNHCVRLEHLD